MKNKKAIYGTLMLFSMLGVGIAIFFMVKKKGLVMQAESPNLDSKILEKTDNKVVTEVITTTGEKVINTETIVDGKRQVISEFEDGRIIKIEDADKLAADVKESFKDLDLSGLDNLKGLANLDLSGLEGLKDFSFNFGLFSPGAMI